LGLNVKLSEFLSGKGRFPAGKTAQWLQFCTLHVTTGSVWAGDPYLANAVDGCVVKVPHGKYLVEAVGLKNGRYRVVSRLRVRLATAANPELGKEVGQTGTDSAMIGVCDIKAFDADFAQESSEAVHEAVQAQTESGFGIVKAKRRPGAVMPCVPTGSDGSGPVFALVASGRLVGIQLNLMEEVEQPSDAGARGVSLLGNERDDFKTWALAGGGEASCWLGGELKAGADIHIWSDAPRGTMAYRIRASKGRLVKTWTPMAKIRGGGARFGAVEVLGAGQYELEFQIGKEVFSAITFILK
jgi:hypothetical protein